MAYVTRAQLIKRFGRDELIQLTDRDDLGDIDDAVLADAIADAEAIIDAKLRVRGYTLPLDQALIDASPLIRYAGDITRYLLMDDGATEEVSRRHEEALRWLNDVGAGRATLGEQQSSASTSRMATASGRSGYDWGNY